MESLAELLATGRVKDASELAKKRLAQNPGDPEALLAQARLALIDGRIAEAEALVARAAPKAAPQDVTLLRASLATLKGQTAAARDLYESLTRQPQAPAEAWYGLGLSRSLLGDLPGACDALDKAVHLNPRQPSFRFELGRAFTLVGMPRAAVFHLTRGIRLNPQDDRAFRVVADIVLQRGHARQARRILELGLRNVPDSALLRDGLAALPEAGNAQAQTSPSVNPKEQALIAQVNELMQRSRNREALKLLREASTQGLRTVALKLLEADACESMLPPDVNGATRAYEEAIALAPNDWVIYSNMGLFILRHGGLREVSRAIQVLEEARRRNPTRPEPALNLALAYLKGGRNAEAVDMATQLVQGLPPEHPLATQARQIAESVPR
jgi:tetratricopeptide (TPR) repeat protein